MDGESIEKTQISILTGIQSELYLLRFLIELLLWEKRNFLKSYVFGFIIKNGIFFICYFIYCFFYFFFYNIQSVNSHNNH